MIGETLMVCFSELCEGGSRQFYYYPSERALHRHHPICMVHPATFDPLFNEQELFTQHELDAISMQMEQAHQQLHGEVANALWVALEGVRSRAMEALHVFRNGNEIEFARKLEEVARGGNPLYLHVARLAATARAHALKQTLTNLSQDQLHQLRDTLLHLVDSAFTSSAFPAFPAPQDLPHAHQDGSQLHLSIEEEQEEKKCFLTQQDLQTALNTDHPKQHAFAQETAEQTAEQLADAASEEGEVSAAEASSAGQSEGRRQAGFKEQEELRKPEWRERFEQTGQFDWKKQPEEERGSEKERERERENQRDRDRERERDRSRMAIRGVQKLKRIQKERESPKEKRGRPPKGCKPPRPIYEDVFEQSDMDMFFPKTRDLDFVCSISEMSASPFFHRTRQANVCIRNEADVALLQSDRRLREEAEEVTICQRDVDLHLGRRLHVYAVMEMFAVPNKLTYLHLKEVLLEESSLASLRQLLERNLNSLQTLMLEESENVSKDLTEVISAMTALRKLKLQSGYYRKFRLCLQHIFAIEHLEALSLGSAVFIDVNGNDIEEDGVAGLRGLEQLRCLKFLSFYNCYPVVTELLTYLHPAVHSSLAHLNIGITDVTPDAVPILAKLRNLVFLNIDETQLKGRDLVRIFQGNPDCRLEELSLWRLNGAEWKEGKRGFRNGSVSREDMTKLARLLHGLKYLNIAHCQSLSGFNLLKFPALEHVCISTSMYSARELARFSRRLNVYTELQADTRPIPTYVIDDQ